MYFWNTKKLALDIKNEAITQRNYKNYYLATSFIVFLNYFFIYILDPVDVKTAFVSFVVSICLSIWGINRTFRLNGAEHGKNFIAKSFALGFPVLIKITIFANVGSIPLIYYAMTKTLDVCTVDMTFAVLDNLCIFVFYLSLGKHIKSTCETSSSAMNPEEILK